MNEFLASLIVSMIFMMGLDEVFRKFSSPPTEEVEPVDINDPEILSIIDGNMILQQQVVHFQAMLMIIIALAVLGVVMLFATNGSSIVWGWVLASIIHIVHRHVLRVPIWKWKGWTYRRQRIILVFVLSTILLFFIKL